MEDPQAKNFFLNTFAKKNDLQPFGVGPSPSSTPMIWPNQDSYIVASTIAYDAYFACELIWIEQVFTFTQFRFSMKGLGYRKSKVA